MVTKIRTNLEILGPTARIRQGRTPGSREAITKIKMAKISKMTGGKIKTKGLILTVKPHLATSLRKIGVKTKATVKPTRVKTSSLRLKA